MVEGKTLLVLLLLGRCQHPATVPQSARKSTVFAQTNMSQHLRIVGTTLNHAGTTRFERRVRGRSHVVSVGTTWNHMGTALFLRIWLQRNKHVPAFGHRWNHVEPHRNHTI